MSVIPPPIRESWKTDKDGKLISLPWILWLQQLASTAQAEDIFSGVLSLVSTAEASSVTPAALDDVSDAVDAVAIMSYNPSSGSISPNDAEMFAWMSF